MSALAILKPSRGVNTDSDLAQRRVVPWLHSSYLDSLWEVSDTHEPERTIRIEFPFPLANGTCVTASRFYRSITEVTWHVRSSAFGTIDDANTQYEISRALQYAAHSLSRRGIFSFADAMPGDIDEIVEESRYGVDALTRASDRIQEYFDLLENSGQEAPRYRNTVTGKLTALLDTAEICRACSLPYGVIKRNRRATWALVQGARRFGVQTVRDHDCDGDIPPLDLLTSTRIYRYLGSLELLYTLRRKMHGDGLSFRPFDIPASRVAKKLGVGTERTPIAPPRLALQLMECAARWVVDYSPALLECLSKVRKIDRNCRHELRHEQMDAIGRDLPSSGPEDSPWPVIIRARQRTDVGTFNEAIKHLAVACFILIATFSARRLEEILELTDDCLVGDDSGGWWLNVYIEKTLQRKEWIPVPRLVARAIEILRTISLEARQQTDSNLLFQWLSPFTREGDDCVIQLRPEAALDSFAAAVGLPPWKVVGGQQPEYWHWTPHQFRRFFAVLYYYRFEGSIESLSHHLRHFNLNMTRGYITRDPEVASLWNDVEWGYTGHIARAIVAGDRSLSGGMGHRLGKAAKRIIRVLREKLQVISVDRIAGALAMMMRRKALVLTPQPWVVCTSPRTTSAANVAKCQKESLPSTQRVGPDFAHAGPTVCPDCPWAVLHDGYNSVVERELGHLELVEAAKPRGNTLFGELEAAHVISLREVREHRPNCSRRPLVNECE